MFFVLRSTLELIEKQYQRESALLTRELNFYREKFEKEQERADRLSDQLLVNTAGLEPVSQVGIETRKDESSKRANAMGEMLEQLQEVYSDQMENIVGWTKEDEPIWESDPEAKESLEKAE